MPNPIGPTPADPVDTDQALHLLDVRDSSGRLQHFAPVHRGPVQDESGRLDPVDEAAMRAIEGRGS